LNILGPRYKEVTIHVRRILKWARQAQSLRAGRFGDRSPVTARFTAPARTGLGSHPATCTVGRGSLLRG